MKHCEVYFRDFRDGLTELSYSWQVRRSKSSGSRIKYWYMWRIFYDDEWRNE